MNLLMASTFLLVTVAFPVTQGLELGNKCTTHDQCSPTGAHCEKQSDCDDGYCVCIRHLYYSDDGKTCMDVEKVLHKGDSCSKSVPGGLKEQCGKHLSCSACPGKDALKCRSYGSSVGVSLPIFFLSVVSVLYC